MKLKTLALMAASAIGFNANALDLNSYHEYEIDNVGSPTLLENGYYANSSGRVFRDTGSTLEFIYGLNDGYLVGTNGRLAVGYSSENSHYYLCNVKTCSEINSRTILPNHTYSSGGINDSHPVALAKHTEFTRDGNILIKSRYRNHEDYTVSVFNLNGVELDSFTVNSRAFTFNIFGVTKYNYLDAVTDITDEIDFKLLTSGHNDKILKLKKWNGNLNKFETIQIKLNDGQEINSVYNNGLAPIGISDPIIENEKVSYSIVVAVLNGEKNSFNNADGYEQLLIGNIEIVDGVASLTATPKIINMPSISYVSEIALNAFYFEKYKLFYPSFEIDLESGEIEIASVNLEGREFSNKIYMQSNFDTKVVHEISESGNKYKIFGESGFNFLTQLDEIDPYSDPNFSIELQKYGGRYYGIEANCTLQTTNAAVNSNEYISLSETALQIPIEWDSLTGEWKGAQSLTGLESVSGSKEFAKFDLTADVTTGTWSMNCSGIASDIEGNKIQLNPAEITINLDDKIHGGANVISGQISIPNTSDYSGVVVTITLNGRQIEVTTQEDGTFEFDRLVAGDYKVHVYSDQYVAACTDLTLSAENTNPVLNIPMYAGDINNDGGVDIGDFSLLSALFGLNADDESFNPLADLNHDDVINVQDLSILGSHFGTDHCEVSPQ